MLLEEICSLSAIIGKKAVIAFQQEHIREQDVQECEFHVTIMNQNLPRTINYNAMLKCIPYISQPRFGRLRLRSLVMFLIKKGKKINLLNAS